MRILLEQRFLRNRLAAAAADGYLDLDQLVDKCGPHRFVDSQDEFVDPWRFILPDQRLVFGANTYDLGLPMQMSLVGHGCSPSSLVRGGSVSVDPEACFGQSLEMMCRL